VLGDGDTFSHPAAGEWIIAHGAAPRVDLFSHSMAGATWIAHEWLSEALLTLAFLLGVSRRASLPRRRFALGQLRSRRRARSARGAARR
jgi:hypothetical protein